MKPSSSFPAVALMVLGTAAAHAQTRIITGRVTDSVTANVVTAGQVSVQGSTAGTSIKDDGTFTIAAPARDISLMFRSIGFKRKDVAVSANQNSVQVALARDYFQLEAIVVTGQATGVERRNLANAVATVDAQQLVKTPTASVEQALSGKLAGITIAAISGAPGGGMMVRLRGVTSIIGNASPLYVIDGVIASDVAVPPGINTVTKAAIQGEIATTQESPVNRIADLNPNDIENIEVLKGASASAIYGSKASNGVILITTKRGRVGQPQFSVSQRFGINSLYERHRSRQFNSVAEATSVFGATVGALWTPTFYDHDLELAGNKPLSYETSASVSGGTEDTRYFASAVLKHDGGVITRTFGDKQGIRLNIEQQVGSRFNFGMSGDITRTASDRGLTGNDNSGTSYYYTFPYTPSFFDLRGTCGAARTTQARCADGTVPVYPRNPSYSSNPLQTSALLKNEEVVWRSIIGGRASLDLVKNAQHTLQLLGNGGADFFNQKNSVFSPPELHFEADDGLVGTSALSYTQNVNTNVNGNAVYTFKPSSGAFTSTLSAGVQYETRYLNTSRTVAQNLIGGLPVINGGTAVSVLEDRQRVKDFGMFAQEEFLTLNERLLVTFGLRADQSSNNGDPKKLFYYPKSSASYRFTSVIPGVIDELKLRAAFGQSGNQPKFGQKFIELTPGNVIGVPTFQLSINAGDPTIKPERQREIETGFDATLLRGRANLEVTLYEKRISDVLLQRSLQPSQGFRTLIFNGGVMRNRGLETQLRVIPIQTPSFQWSTQGNFALTRCKIMSLPVPLFRTSGVQIEEGKSCTQSTGRDTLPTGASVNPTIIGEGTPKFATSLANDFTIKAFRVYFMWFWQKGGLINDRTLVEYDLGFNTPDYAAACTHPTCQANETLGAWRVRMNRTRTAKVYTQDASYMKLREVTLSFDVPRSLIQRVWSGARYVRLGLAGRNLLTLTDCSCDEPEQGSVATIFGAASNAWKYPSSRSFWFTVDVGF